MSQVNIDFLIFKAEAEMKIYNCLKTMLLRHCNRTDVFIDETSRNIITSASNSIANVCVENKKDIALERYLKG